MYNQYIINVPILGVCEVLVNSAKYCRYTSVTTIETKLLEHGSWKFVQTPFLLPVICVCVSVCGKIHP